MKITIYTDGSARGNPGKAGWGALIIAEDKETELGGRKDHGTNNQMELTAPTEALKYLTENKIQGEVEIFSDSKYVINGINEWIHGWIKNGWRNTAKKPVLNKELWEDLHKFNSEVKPKWHYVAGHSGHKYNDRVDMIATSFADGEPVDLKTEVVV